MNNKELGGELTEAPNDQYKKFFEKFKEIETSDVTEWKTAQVLGYFVDLYNKTYHTKYQFKFNSPSPSKSFEVFQIKKLAMQLSSSPNILKDYIDWVFANKVTKAKRKLTSISFLTNEGTLSEFKKILLSGKTPLNVDRSSSLPEKFRDVFSKINIKVNTYGDLAFLSQISDMPEEVIQAFIIIEEMGFDKTILTRII